ncbi:hypothetical protein K1X76_04160 [bacterium]|nr:hypothetical protein [bacterium]
MNDLPQNAMEMKDILPPEDLISTSMPIWIWLLVALLLLVIVFYLFKNIHKKIKAKTMSTEENILQSIPLYKKGLVEGSVSLKEAYFFLSQSLKQFLEEQSHFHATDMTSQEIEKFFKSTSNLTAPLKQELTIFLHYADGIKFAGIKHAPESFEGDSQLLLRFIKDIKNETTGGQS